MDVTTILIIICLLIVGSISYLHIKSFMKKTKDPSIEQAEFYKPSDIMNNHKNDKNIYIIRVYSNTDENLRILNTLKDTNITSFSLTDFKDKSLEEKLTLHNFMNGHTFSDNTLSYMFHLVPTKAKNNIPTLENIYSSLAINKNIYLNVGMKLQKLPLICTTLYDRCFLHILKGTIKIKLYDPSQSKNLYRDYQKKMKCLKNTDSCFANSKINLTVDPETSCMNFPNYGNAFGTEVLLREGNLMYIPNFWWFTIEYQDDSVCLFYTSNTIISYLYNKIY